MTALTIQFFLCLSVGGILSVLSIITAVSILYMFEGYKWRRYRFWEGMFWAVLRTISLSTPIILFLWYYCSVHTLVVWKILTGASPSFMPLVLFFIGWPYTQFTRRTELTREKTDEYISDMRKDVFRMNPFVWVSVDPIRYVLRLTKRTNTPLDDN